MQKPAGYDGTEAKNFGVNQRPPAGAYVLKILQVKDAPAGNGRPMLSFCLDIAEGPFKDNFKKLFEFFKQKNPDAKWPLVHRRCYDESQIGYFKGDIKSIEESNDGYKYNFDENTLKGKLVGCMLGEKIIGEDNDGNAKTVLEPRWFMSKKSALEFKGEPPKPKQDKQNRRQPGDDFGVSNPVADELLPF